jgi:hypothetical protein
MKERRFAQRLAVSKSPEGAALIPNGLELYIST